MHPGFRLKARRGTPPGSRCAHSHSGNRGTAADAKLNLLATGQPGRTEKFPSVPVKRRGRLQIEASTACRQELNALQECFSEADYSSTSVTLTRLRMCSSACPAASVSRRTAYLIGETTHVARQIDPSLADVPFVSLTDNAFTPDSSSP